MVSGREWIPTFILTFFYPQNIKHQTLLTRKDYFLWWIPRTCHTVLREKKLSIAVKNNLCTLVTFWNINSEMNGHRMFCRVFFFSNEVLSFPVKSHIFFLEAVGLNKKQMLNFISVKLCLALKNKTYTLLPWITHCFMSQNEYLHRLVQIIYDTTILNTTDMFLLQQSKSQERQSVWQ